MKRLREETESNVFPNLPLELILEIFWFAFQGIGFSIRPTRIAFQTRLVSKLWQGFIEKYIIGAVQKIHLFYYPKMNDSLLPLFHSLMNLDLRNNIAITSKSLTKLTKLESLVLSYTSTVELNQLKELSNLTSLKLFKLSLLNIKSKNISIDLPNLSSLSLDSIHCINNDTFKSLTRLRCLSLHNTNIKGSHLFPLIPNLRQLEFRGSSYNIDSDKALPFLSQLEILIVGDDYPITDRVISSLSSLTELNLKENGSITLAGLKPFKNTLKVLRFYEVSSTILRNLNEFPQLETIYMKKGSILPIRIIELQRREINIICI